MVKENTFINIQAFMVNDLHLKGNELIIYAIIWGFSQDGISEFKGGLQYLADWTNSTQQGVLKALKNLLQKQLILKNEKRNGFIKYCTYKTTETKFNGNEPLNKVELPTKQSLINDETKFNGAIKQSLSNNINNTLDNTKNNNIDSDKPKSDVKIIIEAYNQNYKNLYQQGKVKTEKPIVNYSQATKLINGLLKSLSRYDIIKALDKALLDDWIVNGGYCLTTILSANCMNKLLNGLGTPKYNVYNNLKRPASDSNVGEIDF